MTIDRREPDRIVRVGLATLFPFLLILQTPAGSAAAQFPPDSLKNLQVLPTDIETRELIDTMRGFATGLGVRCPYCHVGEQGQPLATFDFPSDEKATKRKARQMLRMVRRINEEFLASLDDRSVPPIEVTCVTCHHGQSRPRTLENVLLEAHSAGGIDSAVAQYRTLRSRYYGSWAFDFTEGTLRRVGEALENRGMLGDALAILELNHEVHPNSVTAAQNVVFSSLRQRIVERGVDAGVAHYHEIKPRYAEAVFAPVLLNILGYRLLDDQKLEEAVAIFELNVEMFPGDWNAHDSLGEGYMARGDNARAIESYSRSVELNPENDNGRRMLERLRDGGAR